MSVKDSVNAAKRGADHGNDTFVEGVDNPTPLTFKGAPVIPPEHWEHNDIIHSFETVMPSEVLAQIPLELHDDVAKAFNTLRNQAEKIQLESRQTHSKVLRLAIEKGETLGLLADVVSCRSAMTALPPGIRKRVKDVGEPFLLDRIRDEMQGGLQPSSGPMFGEVTDTQDPVVTCEQIERYMPSIIARIEHLMPPGVELRGVPRTHVEGAFVVMRLKVDTGGKKVMFDYPGLIAAVQQDLAASASVAVRIND